MDRKFNRPRRRQLKEQLVVSEDLDENHSKLQALNAERAKQYEQLNEKMEMLENLKALAHELRLKRELSKGEEHKKVTLPDGTVAIKWKKIRK